MFYLFIKVALWPLELQSHSDLFGESEKSLITLLLQLDQHHLFKDWEPSTVNDRTKLNFLKQVSNLNKSYPGGLRSYIEQSRALLKSAQNGENPLDGWRPEIPTGVSLEPFTAAYDRYESMGKGELGHCGFILVAGGLGERLGYNGIKIELPSNTTTNVSYIELYCREILAIQGNYVSNFIFILVD